MENTEKMYLLPEFELKKFLEKALKLAKFKLYNENFNVILKDQIIHNSNIIDYFIENKDFPYKNEIDSIIDKKDIIIYTKKSPNYYKKEKTKWINVE